MIERCFKSADILLPNFSAGTVDPEKWSVIACDQYTSEEEYWIGTEKTVGDAPSTLRLILPEVYLAESDERVSAIRDTSRNYLREILVSHPDAVVYTERVQRDGRTLCGVVLAVDLEAYDFSKGTKSLIRPSEATVKERIPPRMAVRMESYLESPHILLLVDDEEDAVLSPLSVNRTFDYDFTLMQGGGQVRGRFLNESEKETLGSSFDALLEKSRSTAKKLGADPILFAVGDGNHSLATAKAVYEKKKAEEGDTPSVRLLRYALCEVVNLHSAALTFEPIYRVVFRQNDGTLLREFERYLKSLSGKAEAQSFTVLYGGKEQTFTCEHPVHQLAVGTLQNFLDERKVTDIDYIHGEDSVRALCKEPGTVGFLFEGMAKSELFRTVMLDGALPRKTFSMGHAYDKRYYLECRQIRTEEGGSEN